MLHVLGVQLVGEHLKNLLHTAHIVRLKGCVKRELLLNRSKSVDISSCTEHGLHNVRFVCLAGKVQGSVAICVALVQKRYYHILYGLLTGCQDVKYINWYSSCIVEYITPHHIATLQAGTL